MGVESGSGCALPLGGGIRRVECGKGCQRVC